MSLIESSILVEQFSQENSTPSNSSLPESVAHLSDFLDETDNDGTLRIISYHHCDNDTSEEVKKLRGAVFHGENLLFSSEYTPEYNETDDIKNILSSMPYDPRNPTKMFYFKAEEGTMIRVFFFKKWYISTHRRLDAFKSRWSGKESYGSIFQRSLEACGVSNLEEFLDSLNMCKIYYFFIRNTEENRIVCKPPVNPVVFQVGTMDYNGRFSFAKLSESELLNKVPKQESIFFRSYGQVFKSVKTTDPFVNPGLIIIREDGKQVKITNTKYQLYSQVRGNESSIKFRYLNVRTNPVYSRLLSELYPEFIPFFTLYENTIFKIAKNIHTNYMNRFINKQHVVTDKISFRIIKDAHSRHLANRNFKVTLDAILNILAEPRYCSTVNSLIKEELNPKVLESTMATPSPSPPPNSQVDKTDYCKCVECNCSSCMCNSPLRDESVYYSFTPEHTD